MKKPRRPHRRRYSGSRGNHVLPDMFGDNFADICFRVIGSWVCLGFCKMLYSWLVSELDLIVCLLEIFDTFSSFGTDFVYSVMHFGEGIHNWIPSAELMSYDMITVLVTTKTCVGCEPHLFLQSHPFLKIGHISHIK